MFRSASDQHRREEHITAELSGKILLEPTRLVVAYAAEDLRGALQYRLKRHLFPDHTTLKGIKIYPSMGAGAGGIITLDKLNHRLPLTHIYLNADLALQADRYICIARPLMKLLIHTTSAHLWALLSEEESPLRSVITESYNADIASSFRKIIRDQVMDYAVRDDCAAVARLRMAAGNHTATSDERSQAER
jgi:hypothetical protein